MLPLSFRSVRATAAHLVASFYCLEVRLIKIYDSYRTKKEPIKTVIAIYYWRNHKSADGKCHALL